MVAKDGRFGIYVTDGETNASIGRGDRLEEMTNERAYELLAVRREQVAEKGGPAAKRKSGAKAAAKKSSAKKAAAKKAPAKKATPRRATNRTVSARRRPCVRAGVPGGRPPSP